jgi:5-methyltetrahydropteroyltriglutamate--homocysteine methyltransferase
MLRTTVVGSWPPAERFAADLARYHRGELDAGRAEELLREAARAAIEEQRSCGLKQFTGGETWTEMFILHYPRWLSGLEPVDPAVREGWRSYRAVGPLEAPRGLGVAEAFRREKALAPELTKATIPGPSEIVMLIVPREGREALWPPAMRLINCEMHDLIAAGAEEIQLDVPHVAMALVDGQMATETATEIIRRCFEGVTGVIRGAHFCYGDFQARSWTRNRELRPLIPTIRALDGVIDRVHLELSLPEQWAEREHLREIPPSMEVSAGIVDVKDPRIETVPELQEKMRELLRYVPAERLLIAPSCGLGRRDTAMAAGKVTAMVAAAEGVQA